MASEATRKFIAQLRKSDNVLKSEFDPFAHVLRTPSPSVNWTFGNTWGLPRGMSLALWGRPKKGKSLLSNYFTGMAHQTNPDAVVIKFDTEYRDRGQLSARKSNFGIDPERYITKETNNPADIFDYIENDVAKMCEAGLDIPLIIIDSINGIRGRKERDTESIDNFTIGDHAQTIQLGLGRIIGVQKKYNIALILTSQARAEMNMHEQKRGHTTKMAASFALQHHCEYFMQVDSNDTAAGKEDLLGNRLENDSHKDLKDKAEVTGHKIRVWMQDSSMGPKNRNAEFTLDHRKGIINVHEEVFRLGDSWGVIERVNKVTFAIDGETFRGKPAVLEALAARPDLQQKVIKALMDMENSDKAPVVSEEKALQEFENGIAEEE